MFHTKIDTPDNVLTLVGNNTIFTGNIQNFSANPYSSRPAAGPTCQQCRSQAGHHPAGRPGPEDPQRAR